jgi:hypothetical protein
LFAGQKITISSQRRDMKVPISKETASARAAHKFNKLYAPLIELVDSLQDLEPGGTLADDIVVARDEGRGIHLEYVAKPVMLTIKRYEAETEVHSACY